MTVIQCLRRRRGKVSYYLVIVLEYRANEAWPPARSCDRVPPVEHVLPFTHVCLFGCLRPCKCYHILTIYIYIYIHSISAPIAQQPFDHVTLSGNQPVVRTNTTTLNSPMDAPHVICIGSKSQQIYCLFKKKIIHLSGLVNNSL